MKMFSRTAFAAALLLAAAPAFAEEAHHPATTEAPAAGSAPEAAAQPAAPATSAAPTPDAGSPMMGGGMMGGDMMEMMKQMMGSHAGMMRSMMSADGMAGGGPIRHMMSADRVEGRIAFLRTELKVTEAQEKLWEPVADALRAQAGASKNMMPGTDGMMQGDSSKTLPQRIADRESALSARLDSLRRLKATIEPFYASLDETQKKAADDLLMPMGMM